MPTTGIILAGTYPWSNSPFDRLMPRALLPVAHRPMISYALSWFQAAGIREVAVCGNRHTRALQETIVRRTPPGMTVSYQEDPVPRGPAGSIRDVAISQPADTFVVAEATAIPSVDLPQVVAGHHARGAALTVVVHRETGNRHPAMDVSTGIYVFDRRAIDHIPPFGFCDIKEDLISRLYRAGEAVVSHTSEGPSARVLNAATYLAVNAWVVERLVSSTEPPPGYVRVGKSLVHADASIADDAVFVGPSLVGPGAQIRPGATIIGPTSIGRDAIVGRRGVVSRAAIWRRAILRDGCAADRSILADDSVVEAPLHSPHAVIVRQPIRPLAAPAPAERRAPVWQTANADFYTKLGRLFSHARFPAAQ